MNVRIIARILRKDLAIGPRNPIMLFVIILPIIMTFVLQMVFGDLFIQNPKLALLDEGSSQISTLLEERVGIDVVYATSVSSLKQMLVDNDANAGLVLQPGFDLALQNGDQPLMEYYIGGESYAVDRLVLTLTALDLIREVQGNSPAIAVEVIDYGSGDSIPMSTRLVPLVVLFAFIMAGLFVPASSVVDEREKRTVIAVLSSPAKIGEFLSAKALLGMILSFLMAIVILILNKAFMQHQLVLVLVLFISSFFWALVGLLIGLLSANSQTLFAIVKGSGVFLVGPAVFYLFPEWPQWIARVVPTFWAIDPLWQVLANQAPLRDILGPLAVVVGMIFALIFLVRFLANRMLMKLANS
jgi:ABC-2 type transport system permease protein